MAGKKTQTVKVLKASPIRTVYQPVVEIRTGKVFGYEALTRGHGKFKNPDALFRRSYEEGLAMALDLECQREALKVLPKLRREQLLFVNVEPVTIANTFEKGSEIDFLLKKYRSYASRVVFELTEGMKGRDFRLVQKGVAFLKELRCRFAIDDVAGIGFKLLKLLSLRPDFLKIDITVVRGIKNSTFHQDIFKQILKIASDYGATVVAEGVERKGDLEYIHSFGVPYAQGYYFAQPARHLASHFAKLAV